MGQRPTPSNGRHPENCQWYLRPLGSALVRSGIGLSLRPLDYLSWCVLALAATGATWFVMEPVAMSFLRPL